MEHHDSSTLAQERFGRFAQRYVTSPDHAEGRDLERLVTIADPQPHWVALDVATGGGHTALRFAPLLAHVVATDLAPGMLEAAQAHLRAQGIHNVTFELADAEDLPFDDVHFDLVTCRIAPHHFGDCARFVRECARVLRSPDGTLVVQDHLAPDDPATARYVDAFERLRDPSHHRAFSEREWVSMFEDAGLVVTHTEQVVKEHAFLDWARRQDCTTEIVERLVEMMQSAPEAVCAWMKPRGFGTPDATFINHHFLISGCRRG